MVIDHIGLVVQSLDKGIEQWEQVFGYKKNSAIALNTRQKVRVVFLWKKDSITVKLIEPSDVSSPIAAFARRGGGLHHLCFRCDNTEEEIRRLRETGARLIVPPEPGEAFNDHPIAFLLLGNNLNVELIDTTEKHGWSERENTDPA